VGTANDLKNRRILVIDDSEDIHADFRRILTPGGDTSELDALEASFFGAKPAQQAMPTYQLGTAHQGAEALEKVRRARAEGAPFALAFVDMRMPPGWDGVETLTRLWQEDGALQAVICSAYSDYSWEALAERFGQTDRLLVLKKPFDAIEVRQMACALTEKWNQQRQVEEASRRLEVQYAVTRSLMESATLEEAGPKVLGAIGEAFGWPFGALWLLDEEGRALRCAAAWSAGGKVAELAAAAAGATHEVYRRDEGPLGRALSASAPEFSVGVEYAAAHAGLRAAIRCPIRTGGAGVGVLEMLSRTGREPDRGLLELLGDACARIAHAVEGQRVAAALRAREAREMADRAELRAQEEILRARAEALTALSMPLIPISDDIVIMPLVGEMDGQRMRRLVETLAQGVSERGARVVLLDVTGVPTLGPDAAAGILRAAQAVRLLGAEIILTGIQPEVAQALVDLEANLGGVVTRRTLQSGVAFAMRRR